MRRSVDNVNHKGIAAGEDAAVLELVHTVMHRFRSLQYRALEPQPRGDGEAGLTHMEGKVLGFFAHHPDATQRDLAHHSGRDKAQLARLIKSLRERGLLEGEADEADRRNVRLRVTAAGQAITRTLRQQGRKLEARAVAGLSDGQRRELVTLLQQVLHNLDSELERDAGG
ncbi:MAG TPA: MarR family winged helix-turn-helix transcriptional regulator [Burkholderiaceae bacterium]